MTNFKTRKQAHVFTKTLKKKNKFKPSLQTLNPYQSAHTHLFTKNQSAPTIKHKDINTNPKPYLSFQNSQHTFWLQKMYLSKTSVCAKIK